MHFVSCWNEKKARLIRSLYAFQCQPGDPLSFTYELRVGPKAVNHALPGKHDSAGVTGAGFFGDRIGCTHLLNLSSVYIEGNQSPLFVDLKAIVVSVKEHTHLPKPQEVLSGFLTEVSLYFVLNCPQDLMYQGL